MMRRHALGGDTKHKFVFICQLINYKNKMNVKLRFRL
jgi:hypothetical protein